MADLKNIVVFQGKAYAKPDIVEHYGRKWVTYGERNQGFQEIIDCYNGSPTNEAVINVFNSLLYGKGISVNGSEDLYEELLEIYPKDDIRKCLNDRKMFGQYARQIQRAKGGGVAKITHFPINTLAMEKADDKGVINNVYYSFDWSNTTKYRPVPIKVYNGKLTDSVMIQIVKPYSPGCFYFSDPDYLAALPYCQLEQEISNFYINHIKNGLSFGGFINFFNGAVSEEQKAEFDRLVHEKFTGSSNAGNYVLNFTDSPETGVTYQPVEVSEAHSQWSFISEEAKMKIITAHGAYPNLFGIPTGAGFSNNADELDTSSRLLQDYQIDPIQMEFLDSLKPLLELNNLEADLVFIPLRDSYKSTEGQENNPTDESVSEENTETNEEKEVVEMSDDVTYNIEAFLNEGEDSPDGYEVLDERDCNEMTLSEVQLNTIFEFARVPKDDKNIERSRSGQDTSLFKIRYKYAGSQSPERDFCKAVMNSGKVWKAETLNKEQFITPKMGKGGSNTYNPFLYKGGVNCKHWWQRVIYLKSDNKFISVNKARKLILELEPEDRDEARWQENPKEVAQPAQASNNHWRVN